MQPTAVLTTTLISLLALVAAVPPCAGEEKPGLEAAAFMAGHWVGDVDGALSEEIWTAPAGDSMLGMWRLVAGGEAEIFELLAISPDPTHGLVLRLRHFSPTLIGHEKAEPLVFPLVRAGEGEVVFEGDGPEGKVRLTYRREDDATLVGILEKGGKTSEFRYRRRG